LVRVDWSMVIGVPYEDVVGDESYISRNNGNFHWIPPYGTRRECGEWEIMMGSLSKPSQDTVETRYIELTTERIKIVLVLLL